MSEPSEAFRYWAKTINQAAVILTGASDAQLRVQLFDVLEEFFDGSNCWKEAISFVVIPDTVDYQIKPVTGRILRLDGVYDENNVPQAAVMPVIGTVHFQFPYSQTQSMTAVVVKNVTDPLGCNPPNIPDWVLPAHGQTIVRGLVGSMMLQPGTSYSNQEVGLLHMRRFRDGVAKARVAAMRSNTVGAQAWAYPQNFRTRSQRSGVSTFNVNPNPPALR